MTKARGTRRRLCFVIPPHWSGQMGGAQYQAKLLIELLAESELFEIWYLARRVGQDYRPTDHVLRQIADETGIRRYGHWLDHLRLMKLLREIRPDVIYQRVGCGYTGTCAWYARKYGARMVWHIAHDRTLLPMESSQSLTLPFAWIEHHWMRYGIRNADRIVAQTCWQKRELKRCFGRDSVLIPNFHPDPGELPRRPANPVQIIWVANLKSWKRPELFIELSEELGSESVLFTMVGKPSSDHKWMRELEIRIQNAPFLRYVGSKTQKEVNDFLARSHLFVNTSQYEGFANTFIQAWLRKVPVASLQVDPDNVLRGGEAGYCAAGSFSALRDWIASAIKDTERLDKLGKSARAHANKRHSMKNASELQALFM